MGGVTEGACSKFVCRANRLWRYRLVPRPNVSGSVAVSNRERPVRHLVAISSELAKTKPGADREGAQTVLCDDDPVFVLYRVASIWTAGSAVWAPWFMRELKGRKAIRPLLGLGCSPVWSAVTKLLLNGSGRQ